MVTLVEVANQMDEMIVHSYDVNEIQVKFEKYLQTAGYAVEFDSHMPVDKRLASLVTEFNEKLRDNLGADFDNWLEDKLYDLWFLREVETSQQSN